ncbi:MAG TPA: hypothetical protein VFH78_10525 [Candidatus Thermoplasmatota archaeon]|nr:hypothetical protein [Candidatus Thermoplasmatota archaeon]
MDGRALIGGLAIAFASVLVAPLTRENFTALGALALGAIGVAFGLSLVAKGLGGAHEQVEEQPPEGRR